MHDWFVEGSTVKPCWEDSTSFTPPPPQPFIVPYNWTLGQGRLLCIDHRCLVFTVLLKERFSRSHSTLCVSTVLRLSRRNQACSQEDAVRGECSFQIFSNLFVLVFWAPKLPYFKSFWQRIFSILQNIQQQQQHFHSYIGGQKICSIDDLRLYVWTGLYIWVCQKMLQAHCSVTPAQVYLSACFTILEKYKGC